MHRHGGFLQVVCIKTESAESRIEILMNHLGLDRSIDLTIPALNWLISVDLQA